MRVLQVTYNSFYKAIDITSVYIGVNVGVCSLSKLHVNSKNLQVSYDDNKTLMKRESSEALSKKK